MKYGDIFAMDIDTDLRLMAIGPARSVSSSPRPIWSAVTLYDPAFNDGWAPGDIITFSPEDMGVVIIEESE